jgi:filamentous hemagglutinin family protein
MTTKPDTKSSRKPRAHQAYDLRRKALHLAVASCFSVAPAFAATAVPPSALPANIGSYTYGTAKAGMVTGDVTVGSTRTISNNNNAILNWGAGLNINTGETLRFQQVNDASKVLNRVSGGNATKILGTLSSNGKVYLINNAGVVVGAGAHIDTNGFVASTLNLSDDDFTKGINRFTASTTDATGGVNNAGTITTPNGGFVYLIGAQVENSGVITTPSGEAI